MNDMELEYVMKVADTSVTPSEAAEFLEGLEQFNVERDTASVIEVFYDVSDDGFLTSKRSQFASLKAAMDFVRSLGKTLTKPTIGVKL
jgi:hypothetical protein